MDEQNQEQQAPTMDQLIYALMWELQALRVNVQALNESVKGLNASLIEDE